MISNFMLEMPLLVPFNPDRVMRSASVRYDTPTEDAAKVIESLITKSNRQAASYAEDADAVAGLGCLPSRSCCSFSDYCCIFK
jgi:hypothetical protein